MGQKGKTIIILTTVLLVVINLLNLLSSRFSATTNGLPHSELKKQGNKESEFAASALDKVSSQSTNLSLGNVELDRLVRQLEEMQRNEIDNLKSQDLVYELAENLTHLQDIFRKKGKDLEEKLKGIKNGHQKSSKMVLNRKLLILAGSVQDVEVMKYRAESDHEAVLHRTLIFGNRGRNANIHDEHLFDDCAAGCEFTSNPARFNESDVVILYAGPKGYDALKGKLHRAFSSQRFVYFFFEQPHHYAPRHLTKINKDVGINWTLHYQQDATVFWPYGTYKPRPIPYTLPTNYAQNKTRKVIWVVSNCRTPFAHREHYVAELIEYIDIDVYGTCTNHNQKYTSKGSVADMAAPYKFFISFENGDCDDYIRI
ncbi:FUT7 [Bugula neritina]|uniref:Fucosyltransferase n=1 Tax=Bugula neritina TaxID=10212 RepID=A0A7J7JQK2_BUGNE|nr:FUT7 [Bugula neritina]